MSCSVAKLIAETVSMNEIGVPVSTETARQIYVFEKSVSESMKIFAGSVLKFFFS